MGLVANACGLVFAALALTLWVLSRPALLQRHRLVVLLGGIGIFALVFCAVSPDDDLFQQELIRPQPQCSRLAAFVRSATKRPSAFVWMDVCVKAGYLVTFVGAGRFLVEDQLPGTAIRFANSTLIHSPPVLRG